MTQTSQPPQPILISSLEHSLWQELHAALGAKLARMDMANRLSPTMLILHDFIDNSVKAMHRSKFMEIAENEFGMPLDGNEESLQQLFQSEVTEHGSRNIAQFCNRNGWHVEVGFPADPEAIVLVRNPVKWDSGTCNTAKLVDALGFQWQEEADRDGFAWSLRKRSEQQPVSCAQLLDDEACTSSFSNIYQKLGYGIIQFSSTGQIVALSRSMLSNLGLPEDAASIGILCAAMPFNFHNDIIWDQALAGRDGIFENYRIRLNPFDNEHASILFNVSGYRDEHAVVHSLWQIVSRAEGTANLSEGSMLSDARIHKITRNYVPQLVEEKAREAVRLGKDELTNEECFVAVLFCDIVGFTSYVESNASSESIIYTLNTILRRVSNSVRRCNGAIDKFMGDSIMAIFRDPADAVAAALDMQSHSSDINTLRSRAGQDTLRLRIGIHCGEVIIGNVGTPERLDWTAIGDVVNTASRIEKNCTPGSILVSQAMRDAIDPARHSELAFGEIFQITVKGKREALSVCHVAHADRDDAP